MQNSTWLVILNPAAGRGKSRQLWQAVAEALQDSPDGYAFEVKETRAPGDATRWAMEGIIAGARQLICVGGDGTLNEVVNGICGQQTVNSSAIRLAFLPAGTGTDWARFYGIPRKLDAWIEMLRQPQERLQDVGRVTFASDGAETTRYFANVAGMAFDAYIVAQQNARNVRGGGARYFLGLLRYLFRYRSPEIQARAEAFTWTGPAIVANVGLGRYSGGGMQLVPRSDPNDGLFDLTIIAAMSPWRVLLNVFRLFDGSIYQHPLAHHHRATTIWLEAVPGSQLELDGELVGQLPARFELVPDALRLVLPPS
ncbi:MAG: diacylglycerol kinase family lipid kinase [Bacteroidetes bacterium]|nr:MAG: diacylglycerol kinase family lipid kinase [Bacteroidota bacterium]